MSNHINVRIIFANKNLDIGGIKSTDTIYFLKSVIKEILLNQANIFDEETKKLFKNLNEDMIKSKIGFPPVTIEGKDSDSKILKEMKISDKELIRVELTETDSKTSKSKENDVDHHVEPVDDSKFSVVRKIIPADNSCLFNAVNYALNQNLSEPSIMRSLIAAEIQSNPEFYNSAILDGKDPLDYCEWIMRDTTWGGGIEISIMSKCFQVRIGVVDIVNCTIEFFGEVVEGKEIAVFDSKDEKLKEEVLAIAKELNASSKFVDTNKYTIKCTVCYTNFRGSDDAVKHSKMTGHINFMQIGN